MKKTDRTTAAWQFRFNLSAAGVCLVGQGSSHAPEQPRYSPEQSWTGTVVSCGNCHANRKMEVGNCPIFAIPTIC